MKAKPNEGGLHVKKKAILAAGLALLAAAGAAVGVVSFQARRKGTVRMIPTDHVKSFSTEYTELVPYAQNDADSRSWMQGMVTGAGENGAVTAGSPYGDTVIYQNIHFLLPSPDPRETPDEVSGQLEAARRSVLEGDDAWDAEGRVPTYFYSFHPGPSLRFTMKKHLCYDYIRWTDFETAEVGVRYTDLNGVWERRTFSSREDNVTVTRIEASSKGKKVDLTLSLDDCWSMRGWRGDCQNLRYKKLVPDDAGYIAQIAHYPDYENSELKNGGYGGVIRIVTVGGTRERILLPESNDSENVSAEKNPAVKIAGAEAVYLIAKTGRTFDMGPLSDFEGAEGYALLDALLSDVAAVEEKYTVDGAFSYDEALKPHAEKHGALFGAVRLDLGDGEHETWTNEELIAAQRESGEVLPAFMERAYHQGRYLQICCAGETFPRLYGMWTGEWNPSWRAIYTMDANVNLQASGMNTGNVREAGEGYIRFVLRQIPDWEKNAEKVYGMKDAIQVPVNTDGDRAMMVEYYKPYPFQYWNAGASWMLRPIWEYRQCFGNAEIEFDGKVLDLDRDVLLPLLTKQANFWEQLCTPEYFTDVRGEPRYEKGKTALEPGEKYLIIPSYSPENAPLGYDSPLTMNAAMDVAAARDGLKMTAEAERTVRAGGWEARAEKWETLASLLPDYVFDDTGALREWATNAYEENNKHRHISHLYAAWPAFETQDDPALAEACGRAIENRNRENEGEDDTAAHGWVHKALVGARLKDGASVLHSLEMLTTDRLYYSSLLTDHYTHGGWGVFCTDAAIGTVGILGEALLYSAPGVIEALPALPAGWEEGSVTGLRARTNAEVGLSWTKERVVFTVKSDVDQTLILRVSGEAKTVGGAGRGGEITARLKAGEEKTFTLAR